MFKHEDIIASLRFGWAVSEPYSLAEEHQYNEDMKPLRIAHRGDTQNYPENSIEAFQSAFDLGADGIEFDIQCHENGEIVVVHNYTHDPHQDYPSLEKVLHTFSPKGRLEIEIKALEEECVLKAARIIHRIQPQDFEITSNEIPLIPVIRKYFPDALVGLIFNTCLLEKWMPVSHIHRLLLGYMKLTGANVLHLGLGYYSKELVVLMHENGYRTHTHLGKENIKEYQRVKSLGIDQCSLDDLSILRLEK